MAIALSLSSDQSRNSDTSCASSLSTLFTLLPTGGDPKTSHLHTHTLEVEGLPCSWKRKTLFPTGTFGVPQAGAELIQAFQGAVPRPSLKAAEWLKH